MRCLHESNHKSFINGLLTIVPIILVIYILVRVFNFLDSILGNVLKPYMKQDYIPGIGILATLVLITFLGWLSTRFFAGKIINLIDRLLEKYRLLKRYIVSLKIHFNLFLERKVFFKSSFSANARHVNESHRVCDL